MSARECSIRGCTWTQRAGAPALLCGHHLKTIRELWTRRDIEPFDPPAARTDQARSRLICGIRFYFWRGKWRVQ